MALLTLQVPSITGVLLTFASAAATDTFIPGNKLLIVRNGNAAALVVTVVTPGLDKYQQARADIPSVSITATTGVGVLGTFPDDLADPATGLITVSYSVTPTVTVALVGL